MTTGLSMWMYSTGDAALTAAMYQAMHDSFTRSMAFRAGFQPTALLVDQDAPPPACECVLPVVRTRLPRGHVALQLEHELES